MAADDTRASADIPAKPRGAGRPQHAASEADYPSSPAARFPSLKLDSGRELVDVQIAYQTYGTLNRDRSNAILVCHALTGDQHVASTNPVTGKPGWWSDMIGSGKPIDTDRYFVICQNVIGGCMGSTGPASTNPATDRPYGLELPVITVRDMVRAQAMLIDHLGIETLFSVAGGSLGGMQVLQWAAASPTPSSGRRRASASSRSPPTGCSRRSRTRPWCGR